jgi:hypothetical protein
MLYWNAKCTSLTSNIPLEKPPNAFICVMLFDAQWFTPEHQDSALASCILVVHFLHSQQAFLILIYKVITTTCYHYYFNQSHALLTCNVLLTYSVTTLPVYGTLMNFSWRECYERRHKLQHWSQARIFAHDWLWFYFFSMFRSYNEEHLHALSTAVNWNLWTDLSDLSVFPRQKRSVQKHKLGCSFFLFESLVFVPESIIMFFQQNSSPCRSPSRT